MDLKKYDELRSKIHTKDFEGRNKNLDNWLYRLSFLGNIGSIFFAYFLVSPALLDAISTNLTSGKLGVVITFITTIIILVSFETIKRILIKNLSFDLVKNKFKILRTSILSWFVFSICIIALSFYLSLNGARNFASTNFQENKEIENNLDNKIDSLRNIFEDKKDVYITENNELRETNSELRKNMIDLPEGWRVTRKEYQETIDKNNDVINENENRIDGIDDELDTEINQMKDVFELKKKESENNVFKNIILFLLISTSIEVLIIVGIYFREYYDYNLYIANSDRLEKIYKKRDRYRAMLGYIYKEGKLQQGNKVMAVSKLIDLIKDNTTITNPKKFVETFINDMESLDVFVVQGKRRLINKSYNEALNLVNDFDDAVRILENLK